MALKIFCDVCGNEPKDTTFVFEAEIMEVRDIYSVTETNLNPKKQMFKKQVQICKECYEKHIKPHLKI